ncbi:MAG: hypothetical protein ACRDIF_00010 [Actinomycetota bacterium]
MGRLVGLHESTGSRAVQDEGTDGVAHWDTVGGVPIGSDEIAPRTGHISHGQVDHLRDRCRLRSDQKREAFALAAYLYHGGEERGTSLSTACCDRWAPLVDGIKCSPPPPWLAGAAARWLAFPGGLR